MTDPLARGLERSKILIHRGLFLSLKWTFLLSDHSPFMTKRRELNLKFIGGCTCGAFFQIAVHLFECSLMEAFLVWMFWLATFRVGREIFWWTGFWRCKCCHYSLNICDSSLNWKFGNRGRDNLNIEVRWRLKTSWNNW